MRKVMYSTRVTGICMEKNIFHAVQNTKNIQRMVFINKPDLNVMKPTICKEIF
jgi:hypothetical protein